MSGILNGLICASSSFDPTANVPAGTIGTWYPYFYGDNNTNTDSATISNVYSPAGYTKVYNQLNGKTFSSSRTTAIGWPVATLTNGNATATGSQGAVIDVPMYGGKWYFEYTINSTTYGLGISLGFVQGVNPNLVQLYCRAVMTGTGTYPSGKATFVAVDTTNLSPGDKLGMLIDFNARTGEIRRNNITAYTFSNLSN